MNNDKKKYIKKHINCTNCGKNGHLYKNCNQPITSFGVILVSINNETDVVSSISHNTNNNYNKYNGGVQYENMEDLVRFNLCRDQIKFLLIRRKHTLGFLGFIRGHYKPVNSDDVIYLFKQMTPHEIQYIKENTFDTMWNEVWKDKKLSFQFEYINAKAKYEKLVSPNGDCLDLNFYITNVDPLWKEAEWGFPKGRRNYKENDYDCAIREFKEESNFKDDEFNILGNLLPIEEKIIGTNGIYYKHIYYIGVAKDSNIDVKIDADHDEVGAIGFFSFEEALRLIRPYHIEKKKIIEQLYIYMLNNVLSIKNKYEQ